MNTNQPSPKLILKRVLFSLAICMMVTLSGGKISTASNDEGMTKVESILANMTLEEKVGQMFIFDFRNYNGKGLTEINGDVTATIREFAPGGIILFAENTGGIL